MMSASSVVVFVLLLFFVLSLALFFSRPSFLPFLCPLSLPSLSSPSFSFPSPSLVALSLLFVSPTWLVLLSSSALFLFCLSFFLFSFFFLGWWCYGSHELRLRPSPRDKNSGRNDLMPLTVQVYFLPSCRESWRGRERNFSEKTFIVFVNVSPSSDFTT